VECLELVSDGLALVGSTGGFIDLWLLLKGKQKLTLLV